jgi:hypothetical protein
MPQQRDDSWEHATVRAVPALAAEAPAVKATEKNIARKAGELRPVQKGDLPLPRTQPQNAPFLKLVFKTKGYLERELPKKGPWTYKLSVRRGGALRAARTPLGPARAASRQDPARAATDARRLAASSPRAWRRSRPSTRPNP